ncbi:MAG: hypothetical protein DGJ47_000735 [Rickettsiaceae bacterium]
MKQDEDYKFKDSIISTQELGSENERRIEDKFGMAEKQKLYIKGDIFSTLFMVMFLVLMAILANFFN